MNSIPNVFGDIVKSNCKFAIFGKFWNADHPQQNHSINL